MSIFNHFQHLNLSQGQETALTKLEAFLASPVQVFMLKGYAGSGKTTILKGLIEYLKANKKDFIVLAPTGRAAKILRDKTGHGSTIHRGIYNFSQLISINQNVEDDAAHSFHYMFPLNELNNGEKIIIIDEASMISSIETKHELFTFGTNNLLNDLLTYAKLNSTNSKIIFVGDPAQLPPVGDNKSLALDAGFFKDLGIKAEESEMTEVLRQGNNLILQNALKIRGLLNVEKRTELNFNYDESTFVQTDMENIISKYAETFPVPEIGNGILISYSNSQCFNYNTAIRDKIFPGQKNVIAGDLLLVNNNNYHSYETEIFNGDIVKVVSVYPELIPQSAPVYCEVNGISTKKVITLHFRKISIRLVDYPNEIECYIVDSLLNSVDRDLSIAEMKALYINFIIRFNELQKKKIETGGVGFKVGSEEFKQALKKDPFFNALKVKFGYAITCHKAQGGEWDKVYVDFQGRVSLKNEPLRWCYTAITRGINTVYAVNTPNFRILDKFKFAPIGNIGTIPNEALALESVLVSPFHNAQHHKCKSLKYWEIVEKIEKTDYEIIRVESLGNFQERYILNYNDTEIKIDGHHRLSGHFIEPFKVVNNIDEQIKFEIESIFNAPINQLFTINYIPDSDFLSGLHSMMLAACDDLRIPVTNIVKGKQHYVNYFFVSDSPCSFIQFYYNSKGQLTTALPKTYNCSKDSKLQNLTQKLLEYAS
jgi:hypothetical protein